MKMPAANRLLCALLAAALTGCAVGGAPGNKSVRQSLPLIESALKERRFQAADSLAKNAGGWLGMENARRANLKKDVASVSSFLAQIGDCEKREIKQAGVENLSACYQEAISAATVIPAPSGFSGEFDQYLRSKAQTAQRKLGKFAAYRKKTGASAGKDLSPNQLEKWMKNGFEPNEIVAWASQGFAPAEAADWKDKGFAAGPALAWKTGGFEPDSALQWHAQGLAPEAAKGWSSAGFAAGEIVEWTKCSSVPDSAAAWKQMEDYDLATCQRRQTVVQTDAHNPVASPAKLDSRRARPKSR